MGNKFVKYYEIGGIPFSVTTPFRYADSSPYSLFCVPPRDVAVRYDFDLVPELPEMPGDASFEDAHNRIFKDGDTIVRYVGFFSKGKILNPPTSVVRYRPHGDTFSVALREYPDMPRNEAFIFRSLCLEHLIASHDGVILHSSYIATDRGAILFTAPSGTGKSTQAELWRRHRAAEVVNGDCSVVRRGEDGFFAWGLPFNGTSGICRNKNIPLLAIVYLTQHSENRITRLGGAAAMSALLEGSKVNMWDPEDGAALTKMFSSLISEVPVFRLDCLPDEGAVECLEEALRGSIPIERMRL